MLLDIYGLVYRAFFALPPLTTRQGVAVNAVYGFSLILTKLLTEEQPTHLIACFDKGLPPERRQRYPDYKAQRSSMPDDLRPQFEVVRRLLQTLCIPVVELDQQEADDVIATLAHQAARQNVETLVVTGDLDLLQMVEPAVTVLVTRRGVAELGRYDEEAVRQRFGLEPSQLADYRGLKGDPSDNLPGVPGVGEKTASKVLQAAGSLDALLANPALAGTPKLQQLLIQYAEQARACRDVSRLKTDLPVELDWDLSQRRPPDPERLYALYHELEFKTLLQQLPEPETPLPSEQELEGEWGVLGEGQLDRLPAGALALALVGERLGVAWGGRQGWEVARSEALLAALQERAVVSYDAKSVLRWLDGPWPRVEEDPMIAAHLLDPARSFEKIADATQHFLDKKLPDAPGAAAAAALLMVPRLREQLIERDQLSLYQEVELPLARLLAEMEKAGVAVDVTELAEIGREVDASLEALQAEIYELAGEQFNLGSPQQLGVILFEKLGLPGGKRNKTGWSTGVEVLQSLKHPLCEKILHYREAAKLKNTYIEVIPGLVEEDGRLRTRFHQTVTATGRLSSSHPNLQNIPVRGELGRRIRRAFVAPPGSVLLAADYDQIELRLMAHLSADEAMVEAFRQGQDIHDFTARQIFGLGNQEVTSQQRRVAKSVNFGLLYGMSDFGLAQRLEIPKKEAKEMINAYFARFPSVKSYIRGVIEEGRFKGYVSTLLGRRRYMPALRSSNFMQRSAAEREATNAPIQGSAADLMKLAMVRVAPALNDLDARMLLQIHDELIFEVEASRLETLARWVRETMEQIMPLRVPLRASLKAGLNWYEVQPMLI